MKYDGTAHISPNGQKFRVFIEANNFRGEVYIDRVNAAELRDTLNHELRFWPQPEAAPEPQPSG